MVNSQMHISLPLDFWEWKMTTFYLYAGIYGTFSSSFFSLLYLRLLFEILYSCTFVPLMSCEPSICMWWLSELIRFSLNNQPTCIFPQKFHGILGRYSRPPWPRSQLSSSERPRNLSRAISKCHLLLQHHVEVVEVAVTPTDVPLLIILAAVILLCNTDEINCILHTVLRTRTC